MFRVNYNSESQEIQTVDEVMALINTIQADRLVDKHLVVIETEANGVMEIGLGMGDDSVVYYLPDSEDEDGKVTCNALVARAKTDEVKVSHALGEEVECTSCNLISIEDGFNILEAFLKGEEFIDFVDWYKF